MANKWILFTDKYDRVKILETDVLVGEKVATILPKGNGKRAVVIPVADVFNSRIEARKAAAAGGKLAWVAIHGYGNRKVLRGRVRQSTLGQYGWNFTIQAVDTKGRRKNCDPIVVSDHNVHLFETEKEALTFMADYQLRDEARIREDMKEVQEKGKELQTIRARMRALKVKIPTEKQLKARQKRESAKWMASHKLES